MEFMSTKVASELWNIPPHIIADKCRKGLIPYAEQDASGSPWRIPINADKPKYTPRKNNASKGKSK